MKVLVDCQAQPNLIYKCWAEACAKFRDVKGLPCPNIKFIFGFHVSFAVLVCFFPPYINILWVFLHKSNRANRVCIFWGKFSSFFASSLHVREPFGFIFIIHD